MNSLNKTTDTLQKKIDFEHRNDSSKYSISRLTRIVKTDFFSVLAKLERNVQYKR